MTTATCPAGHASATTDYCDRCGARIDPAAAAVAVAVAPPPADRGAVDTSATPLTAPCPDCGTPRAGRDRFCEGCGFDFVAGVPAGPDSEAQPPAAPRAPVWSVVVAPDAEHFARTAPPGLAFPQDAAPRTVALDGMTPLRIGRSRSSGEAPPGIDLGGAGGDPAVSRLHASLLAQADGSWAVVDEGSSNGTTINDDPAAIEPHVVVALRDGDRVHVGAWTTITIQRSPH